MLSFSTCWNSDRHNDGEAMLREIAQLGFSRVELSHGLSLSKLPGIRKAVDSGVVSISGVHNYFPSPIDEVHGSPDSMPFTSHRAQDRARAIKQTEKSMVHAKELGAEYVVLHMGSIPTLVQQNYTKRLQHLAREGKIDAQEFRTLKLEFVQERAKVAPHYVARVRHTLQQLHPLAEQHQIQLAIEGRSHFEQMPSDEEMLDLMVEFKEHPFIGYWHDFGHIQRKANLQLVNHEQFLSGVASYLIGGHVNDVQWVSKDHRAPFLGGCVDFPALLSHIPTDVPLVWELASHTTADEIIRAKELWQEHCPNHSGF